ncbi:hypothetical protein ACI65C_002951 [Semiaphis heraclei]
MQFGWSSQVVLDLSHHHQTLAQKTYLPRRKNAYSQSSTATPPENPKIPKKLPMATNLSSNPDANVVIESSNRSRSASIAGSEHADSNGKLYRLVIHQ